MREAFLSKTKETTVPVILSEGTFVATGQESGWADAVFVAQVRNFLLFLRHTLRVPRLGTGATPTTTRA